MTKFLVLYNSPISAAEMMANATPEQTRAGMDAWMAWARHAGQAIVDLGAPLASVGSSNSKVTGFSILQANSSQEIEQLLKEHPHRHTPGASIEIHEFLELPGTAARAASERSRETVRR
jgi:hypothetical protein